MKITKKNNLLVLSGNDMDTLWWFRNHQRDTNLSNKTYEIVNRKSLLWIMDEMESDNLELCFLVFPEPSILEIKLIIAYARDRLIDWHIFLRLEKTYKGDYPDEYTLWKNGKLNG